MFKIGLRVILLISVAILASCSIAESRVYQQGAVPADAGVVVGRFQVSRINAGKVSDGNMLETNINIKKTLAAFRLVTPATDIGERMIFGGDGVEKTYVEKDGTFYLVMAPGKYHPALLLLEVSSMIAARVEFNRSFSKETATFEVEAGKITYIGTIKANVNDDMSEADAQEGRGKLVPNYKIASVEIKDEQAAAEKAFRSRFTEQKDPFKKALALKVSL